MGQIMIVVILFLAMCLWRTMSTRLVLSSRLLNTNEAYAMGSVVMYWTVDRTLLWFLPISIYIPLKRLGGENEKKHRYVGNHIVMCMC